MMDHLPANPIDQLAGRGRLAAALLLAVLLAVMMMVMEASQPDRAVPVRDLARPASVNHP